MAFEQLEILERELRILIYTENSQFESSEVYLLSCISLLEYCGFELVAAIIALANLLGWIRYANHGAAMDASMWFSGIIKSLVL